MKGDQTIMEEKKDLRFTKFKDFPEEIKNLQITYRQEGDYLIPNLTRAKNEGTYGMFGERRKKFLKENRPGTYSSLLLADQLHSHLVEIDQQAWEMMEDLQNNMAAQEGVTDELKMKDHLEWAQRMENIKNRAMEIVNQDLIYS